MLNSYFHPVSIACLVMSLLFAAWFRPHPLSQHKIAMRRCQEELRDLIESSLAHPLFLRLAWSDAASYDASVEQWPLCGGVNGRFGNICCAVDLIHGLSVKM